MSENKPQESQGQEISKLSKLHDSLKDLEVLELMSKKMSLVKDLDKNIKQVATIDLSKAIEVMKELDKMVKQLSTINVTKSSERAKIAKLLEKISTLLGSMSLIDQVINDKNKISKSLEKVSEIAESIPVVEKIIESKDF